MNVYTRMHELMREGMTREGIPEDRASARSAEALGMIAAEFGGQCAYFHRNPPWVDRSIRNEKMRREFNGRNYVELAGRYRVCEKTVRRVVNA